MFKLNSASQKTNLKGAFACLVQIYNANRGYTYLPLPVTALTRSLNQRLEHCKHVNVLLHLASMTLFTLAGLSTLGPHVPPTI